MLHLSAKSRIDSSYRVRIEYILILSVSLGFGSCATGKLYINGENVKGVEEAEKVKVAEEAEKVKGAEEAEEVVYSLYALGDAGEQNDQATAVLDALKKETATSSHPGMVIFLGDNIYPAGLAASPETKERKYGETVLQNQINALEKYNGEIIFIPGNHDWNEFKAGGLEAIKREGEFLQSFGLTDVSLKPTDGCGGPFVKELTRNAVLIIIDSQWWIQDWDKEPKINEGCAIKSRETMIARLKELFEQYHDRQILLAMHHPLESRGPHGGFFSFRDHVFPLSKVVDWLYIPLPVIGSIYPWSRQIFGHPQDENGKAYKEMTTALLRAAKGQEVIFLSGHDHNLQYLQLPDAEILVSGSGSKQNPLANGDELRYGHKAAGFMRLDFYSKGEIELNVFEVDVKEKSIQIVYKARLRESKS